MRVPTGDRPGGRPALQERSDAVRARRSDDDVGASTSLAVAALSPVFVALAFAAFQAALWSHARTEARVVARDTAALVARSGVGPAEARASALAVLAADTSLTDITVGVGGSDGVVVVTIDAEAPGILRGTSRRLSVTVAVPVEQLTPP